MLCLLQKDGSDSAMGRMEQNIIIIQKPNKLAGRIIQDYVRKLRTDRTCGIGR